MEPVQTILQSHHFSSRPAAPPYVSFEIYNLKFIGARPYVSFEIYSLKYVGARPCVSFEIYSLKFIGARPYVYFKVNTDESLGMMIMPKRIKIYS